MLPMTAATVYCPIHKKRVLLVLSQKKKKKFANMARYIKTPSVEPSEWL